MLVSDYLRVAANKAEVVAPLRTFGFHTFPEGARFGPGQDGG